jgi:2-oxoglutarate ferredoxin oxidoreductase subunit delta
MGLIIVDQRYCKGCGLCIEVCSRQCIALDLDTISDKGYHPAMLTDASRCTGCANCAVMCPDIAIKVER